MSDRLKCKSTALLVSYFMRYRWHLVPVSLLTAFQIVINWSWLSSKVIVLGWDRPCHLIESLVYNGILE